MLATIPRDALGKPGALLDVRSMMVSHAGLVEGRQELGNGTPVPAVAELGPKVVVGIDDREARPLDAVLRHAQAAHGPVVDESQIAHGAPPGVARSPRGAARSLDAAGGQAADEPLLDDDEEDDHRHDGDQR